MIYHRTNIDKKDYITTTQTIDPVSGASMKLLKGDVGSLESITDTALTVGEPLSLVLEHTGKQVPMCRCGGMRHT